MEHEHQIGQEEAQMAHEMHPNRKEELSSSANSSQLLLLSIQKDLKNLPPPRPTSSAFIYRVPKEIRQGNEKHYTPTTISIGPLHAGNPCLRAAEELKLRFLEYFLSLGQDAGKTLEDLIEVSKGTEDRARLCYAEKIELSSDEFVKMLLLDGCFILGIIVKGSVPLGRAGGRLLHNLKRDLLLVENQLPYLVLQALYEALIPIPPLYLAQKALNFVTDILPTTLHIFTQNDLADVGTPRHLLELVLLTLCPPPDSSANVKANLRDLPWFYMRSLSELALYGIKLKSNWAHSLTDVQFRNGVLTIPRLSIKESSASLFMNLFALEQCSHEETYNGFFTSYLVLMDILVRTEMDVERLRRAQVLGKWSDYDNQAFVSLFSSLTGYLDEKIGFCSDFHFDYVFEGVTEYCSSRIVRGRAHFMRYYYASRWDILSNILLFILTVTQTLFGVLSYSPKN